MAVPITYLLRSLLSLIFFEVFLGAMLFWPAGDIRWVNGWLMMVVFFVLTVPSIVILWRVNPDIFVARSKIHAGTKGWDRIVIWVLVSAFFAVFPLAALDAGRLHWSAVPPWLMAVGYVLLAVGWAGSIWVYAVNRFAEPTVRIQTDRGQTVIDTGPYAIVRHPLYMWSLFLFPAFPLALGSYWAILPGVLAAIVLVVRTALEDRTLHRELPGYREYAQRVRYRLVPGIW
ncbi:MAG TPA: isoprenylcysteine carboxylmethyltransferase family protein [Pirellulales bacterium]|nr:isoprenylcysteine carboxylmethyltransferase family protein [Pirellulales bacterium]